MIAKDRYGCTGHRSGARTNSRTIRRQRIEARVFAALHRSFVADDLAEAFDAALDAEHETARSDDCPRAVKRLKTRRQALERNRRSIMKAIEDGAPYATFKARFEDSRPRSPRSRPTSPGPNRLAKPPPDLRHACARAIERIDDLLGSSDLVNQAHEFLALLIEKIVLTPDDEAPDAIAAEIHSDLGRCLSAGTDPGEARSATRFIALASQLTVAVVDDDNFHKIHPAFTISWNLGAFAALGGLMTLDSHFPSHISGAAHRIRSRKADQRAHSIVPFKGLKREVNRALANNQVELALQPVVRATPSKDIVFWEALARIVDTDGIAIPAQRFIPLIEGTELGRALDRSVLSQALDILEGTPDIKLSINVDPRHANDREWCALLATAAKSRAECCHRLIVEITETALLSHIHAMGDFIDFVHDCGASIALDDYGAGATAVRSFLDYRFEIVKIDGAFVADIATAVDNQAIVSSFVRMARHFDIMTVAERVDSPAAARTLGHLGVDCLQGFLFGEPSMYRNQSPHELRLAAAKVTSPDVV